MPPCACCGNKDKNKPTCGKRIHPCVRREKERTFTVLQKFDIICDGDIELCELTRDAYENEVRDFLLRQEQGAATAKTFTLDEIVNKLRI